MPLPSDLPSPRRRGRGVTLADRLAADEWGVYWSAVDESADRPVSALALKTDLQRSKRVVSVLRDGIRRFEGFRRPGLSAWRQMVTAGTQTLLLGDPAEGVPLAVWAASPRPWDELAPLAEDLAALLDYTHVRRLFHSHIRPEVVLVAPDGRLSALLGFGANAVALRLWPDTSFRAPELAAPDSAPDDASDQYAFAATLWTALSGSPPPALPAPLPPLSADAPPAADAALRRALAPKPRARFASCADLVRAIRGENVTARRGPGAAERKARRKRLLLAAGLLGGLLLAAGIALGTAALVRSAQSAKRDRFAAPPPPPAAPAKTPMDPAPVSAAAPLSGTPEVATPGSHWATPDGIDFLWIEDLGVFVGRFEIANEQYRVFKPSHDSGSFKGLDLNGPRQPAVRLNFDEMNAFAAWLTERESAAGRIPPGWRFRLPSRLESISCALAGAQKTYPWGEIFPPPPGAGNYADDAFHEALPAEPWLEGFHDGASASAPVDAFAPNAWGLFGMAGNVWETTAADPSGEKFGGWHGGAFDEFRPDKLTARAFYGYMGTARGAVNGFRLVLSPATPDPDP